MVIKVPHYKGLTVAKILRFARSKQNINKYIPDYKYCKEPNREWLWNVINTLIPEEFQSFISHNVMQRWAELIKSQNLSITAKPEFISIFRNSQSFSMHTVVTEKIWTVTEKIWTVTEKIRTPTEKIRTPTEKIRTPTKKTRTATEKTRTVTTKIRTPQQKSGLPQKKLGLSQKKLELSQQKSGLPNKNPDCHKKNLDFFI